MPYTEEFAYEKDGSSPLGVYNLTAVTMDQITAMFDAYMLANPVGIPSLGGLTNVAAAVDSAPTGSFLTKSAGDWTSVLVSSLMTPATTTVLGGIIVGSGLLVQPDGTLSWDSSAAYVLPKASNLVLGGVKIGTGLSIDVNGVLSTTWNTNIDNILDWNGTAYTAYSGKKVSDPGYAYLYTSAAYPTYTNTLTVDGYLKASNVAAMASSTSGTILASTGGISQLYGANTASYSITASDLKISSSTSTASVPIYIGSTSSTNGQKNQYIKADDYLDLFTINFSGINLPQGTASKWLALDANKNITYQDAPGAAYVHHTQTSLAPTLTGANVLASLIVDTEGHTTGATFRTLTLANLGFTGDANANYYEHPLSIWAANQYKAQTIDQYGHIIAMDDTMIVHTIDNETIAGNKTFTGITTLGTINIPNATVGRYLYIDGSKNVAYGYAPQDTVTYTLKMPNAGSVGARVSAMVAGVNYPTTWVLSAYFVNTNHLHIAHNVGKHIESVTVFSTTGFTGTTNERQLLSTAAYSGILALDVNNLVIEGLATYTSDLYVHITFTDKSNA